MKRVKVEEKGGTPRFGDTSFFQPPQGHGSLLNRPGSPVHKQLASHKPKRSRVIIRRPSQSTEEPAAAAATQSTAGGEQEESLADKYNVSINQDDFMEPAEIDEQVAEISKRVGRYIDDYRTTTEALAMPVEDEEGIRGSDADIGRMLSHLKLELDTLINYSSRKGIDRRRALNDIQQAFKDIRQKQREARRQRRREKALERQRKRAEAKAAFGEDARVKSNYGWAIEEEGLDGDSTNELGLALGIGATAGLGIEDDADDTDSDKSVGSIEEEVERGWKDAEHNLKETKNNLNDIMDTILAMMKASTDKPDETLANMRTQLKDAQAMVANIERLLEEKNEELGKVRNRLQELRDTLREKEEEFEKAKEQSASAGREIESLKHSIEAFEAKEKKLEKDMKIAQQQAKEAQEVVEVVQERLQAMKDNIEGLKEQVKAAKQEANDREAAAVAEGHKKLEEAKAVWETETKATVEALEENIATLEKAKEEEQGKQKTLEIEIERLEGALGQSKAEVRSSQLTIEELQNTIKEYQRAEHQRQRREAQQEQQKAQIDAAADKATRKTLEILLVPLLDEYVLQAVQDKSKDDELAAAKDAAAAARAAAASAKAEAEANAKARAAAEAKKPTPRRDPTPRKPLPQPATETKVVHALPSGDEEALREELEDALQRVTTLQGELEEVSTAKKAVEDRAEGLEGSLNAAQLEAEELKASLAVSEKRIAEKEAQVRQWEDILSSRQQQWVEQRAALEMQQEDLMSRLGPRLAWLESEVEALQPPPSKEFGCLAKEKDIDEAMIGYEGGIQYKDQVTKLNEVIREMQKRMGTLRRESSVLQTQNTKLKEEVAQLMSINDSLHADREVIVVLQSLHRTLSSSPEIMTAVAQLRAAMQKQVKEIRTSARAAVQQYADVVKRQSTELKHLRAYLERLVVSAEVEAERMVRGPLPRKPVVAIGNAGARPESIAELKHRMKKEIEAAMFQTEAESQAAGAAAAAVVGWRPPDDGGRTPQPKAMISHGSMPKGGGGSAATAAALHSGNQQGARYDMEEEEEDRPLSPTKSISFSVGPPEEVPVFHDNGFDVEAEDSFSTAALRSPMTSNTPFTALSGARGSSHGRAHSRMTHLSDLNLPEAVHSEIRYWQAKVRSLSAELEALHADTVLLEEVGQETMFREAVAVLVSEINGMTTQAQQGNHISFTELSERLTKVRVRAVHPLTRLLSRISRKLRQLRAPKRLATLAAQSPLGLKDAFDDDSPLSPISKRPPSIKPPSPTKQRQKGKQPASRPPSGTSETTIPLESLEPARTPSEFQFPLDNRPYTAPAVPTEGRYVPSYELQDPRLPPALHGVSEREEEEEQYSSAEEDSSFRHGQRRRDSPVEPPERVRRHDSVELPSNHSNAEVYVVHPPTPEALKAKSQGAAGNRGANRGRKGSRQASVATSTSGRSTSPPKGVGYGSDVASDAGSPHFQQPNTWEDGAAAGDSSIPVAFLRQAKPKSRQRFNPRIAGGAKNKFGPSRTIQPSFGIGKGFLGSPMNASGNMASSSSTPVLPRVPAPSRMRR